MQKPQKRGIILTVSMVLLFFFSAFSPVQAIEYGGLGGKPANPRADNPRTESIFVYTLTPGSVQEDAVLVVNNSPDRKVVLIYAADSTPSTGGAFACKQLAEEKTDVGGWITLAKSEITLEPGTSETISFTVNVPQNAGVGEHNGCVLVQEKKDAVEGQTGAILSVRTGLRVAITIPGEIIRKLEIVDFTVEPSESGFVQHPSVKNTGNVSVDADIEVTTSYFFGKTYANNGGQYPILRGDTSEWNFELEKPFWGGWYVSRLSVEYDENAEAQVGVNSGQPLTKLTGSPVWFFSFPTLLALVIEFLVLLLIVFVIFYFRRKRKRKNWIKKNWVDYTVMPGDDIRLLSTKFDVSWKLLARVNKLKPPYELKPGGVIKVPPVKL